MKYSLRRLSDGAGDSGPASTALWYEDGEVRFEQNARPRVGVELQVGSIYARTYQYQDYWHCTKIMEIIEDTPNRVVFRTLNSLYEWTRF